ncbi:MAG: hypothetical protein HY830_24040 [Actinobacteria bacterium]|nr:hypothetical protein [Actinomycetota bacterium]
MTVSFRLLREALAVLALPAERQREALAGTAVTDELVLDLDNAVCSLKYEMDRTGIRLPPALVEALQQFKDALSAPPEDPLWDDISLDQHPTWASARVTALELRDQVRALLPQDDFKDTP